MTAGRDNLQNVPRDQGSHAGLLLSRYLKEPVPAKKEGGEDAQPSNHPEDRRELQQAAIKAAKTALPIYKQAYQRRLRDLKSIPSLASDLLTVQGRLVVGLGGESVLETGISLHHTYGVPIIPGSALKGLVSHYCHQVWGAGEPAGEKFRDKVVQEREGQAPLIIPQGEYHRILFGAQEEAGYIVFHDAWIEPDCLRENHGLVLDVMTPHHTEYYSGADKPPTDFDGPIPIAFLSVTGRFHIAVSCNAYGNVDQEWADLALKLLAQALKNWGIGGKTSVGYGRLIKTKRVTIDSATGSTEPTGAIKTPVNVNSPRFKSGEEVTVRRVEDPKGKDRIWFEAEDGFGGPVVPKGTEPQIEIGASTTLWIAAVNLQPLGYNFSSKAPKKSEQRQQRKTARVRSFR
ncbi:MAG: type III-B CRISPR module RAMP protein Cmr6 [Candidatus Competibacteraceae bacterium]